LLRQFQENRFGIQCHATTAACNCPVNGGGEKKKGGGEGVRREVRPRGGEVGVQKNYKGGFQWDSAFGGKKGEKLSNVTGKHSQMVFGLNTKRRENWNKNTSKQVRKCILHQGGLCVPNKRKNQNRMEQKGGNYQPRFSGARGFLNKCTVIEKGSSPWAQVVTKKDFKHLPEEQINQGVFPSENNPRGQIGKPTGWKRETRKTGGKQGEAKKGKKTLLVGEKRGRGRGKIAGGKPRVLRGRLSNEIKNCRDVRDKEEFMGVCFILKKKKKTACKNLAHPLCFKKNLWFPVGTPAQKLGSNIKPRKFWGH